MNTTKQNLKKFWNLTAHQFLLDFRQIHGYDSIKYDMLYMDMQRTMLHFALGDYEIGSPTVERDEPGNSAITADMNVHGITGIIMYRDLEITSHS